ncbi:hypothetical protein MJT46_007962 [Ovis ammon polii x Ovis aries]|nr:hypothetical protein MJT46_007962 [Ovis ammon polii x Ovis aries]
MAPNTKLASEEIAAVFPPEKLESLPLLVPLQSARSFLDKESRLTSPTCGSRTSKTTALTDKYTNSGNVLLRHEQDVVHWKVIEIGPRLSNLEDLQSYFDGSKFGISKASPSLAKLKLTLLSENGFERFRPVVHMANPSPVVSTPKMLQSDPQLGRLSMPVSSEGTERRRHDPERENLGVFAGVFIFKMAHENIENYISEFIQRQNNRTTKIPKQYTYLSKNRHFLSRTKNLPDGSFTSPPTEMSLVISDMAKETTEGIKLQKRNYKQDFREEEISYNGRDHLPASLISCADEYVEKIDVGVTFRPCLEITEHFGLLDSGFILVRVSTNTETSEIPVKTQFGFLLS